MPNAKISSPMFDYSDVDYDNNKDIIKSLVKERQDQEKRLKENELLFSTYRGKYGDRNEAHYPYPETEGKNETIPSTESRKKDAKYAKAYNEAVKELMQDSVAEELAESVGDRMKYDLYGRGLNFGEGDDGKPLFFDTQRDLVNDWERVQKERQEAELEKSLKPVELRAKEYPSKTEAFLFGYGPNEEEDGFFDKLGEGEIPSVKDAASEAAYFVPVVGEVKYGANILDRIREGGLPGFVETAMAVPFFGPRAVKLGKSAYRAYKTAPSRRFAKEFRSKDYKTPMIGYEKKVFDDKGSKLQRIDVYPWD